MQARTHHTVGTTTLKMTPLSKWKTCFDKTGGGDETKNEDENDAGNEDKNGHEDPDDDKNEQEALEEALTNNNNETDPDTMSDTMDKQYGAQTRTNMQARKVKSDLLPKLHIHPTINSERSKVLHANAMV